MQSDIQSKHNCGQGELRSDIYEAMRLFERWFCLENASMPHIATIQHECRGDILLKSHTTHGSEQNLKTSKAHCSGLIGPGMRHSVEWHSLGTTWCSLVAHFQHQTWCERSSCACMNLLSMFLCIPTAIIRCQHAVGGLQKLPMT
jgi:hypothetical protein